MSGDLAAALTAIDAANREDPAGEALIYGRRMSEELAAFEPEPSVALSLACRAQHIRRWEIPRTDYPRGRVGYKKWRSTLARFHAERAGEIAIAAGFDGAIAARVGELIRKLRLATDPEVQILEDVAASVFLRYYLGAFAEKHPAPKVTDILRKTMAKMSRRGLERAAAIELPEELSALLSAASNPGPEVAP